MTARVKFGLIIGAIGLMINICVSAVMGICGPFIALIAGAVAGFLAAHAEKTPVRSNGARLGAIAGLIAGALMVTGQMIGGLGILAVVQVTGTPTLFGAPPTGSDTAGQLGYWLGGLGIATCFSLLDIALAAAGGAAGGYAGTPDRPATEADAKIDDLHQNE